MSEYITTDVNKLLIVAPEEACSQAIPEFQRAFEGKASFFRLAAGIHRNRASLGEQGARA